MFIFVPVKGLRRVNVMMKRGGQTLIDHMKKVLNQSGLQDKDYAKDLDERGKSKSSISNSVSIKLEILVKYESPYVWNSHLLKLFKMLEMIDSFNKNFKT